MSIMKTQTYLRFETSEPMEEEVSRPYRALAHAFRQEGISPPATEFVENLADCHDPFCYSFFVIVLGQIRTEQSGNLQGLVDTSDGELWSLTC